MMCRQRVCVYVLAYSGGINTLIDMKYLLFLVPHLSTLF